MQMSPTQTAQMLEQLNQPSPPQQQQPLLNSDNLQEGPPIATHNFLFAALAHIHPLEPETDPQDSPSPAAAGAAHQGEEREAQDALEGGEIEG